MLNYETKVKNNKLPALPELVDGRLVRGGKVGNIFEVALPPFRRVVRQAHQERQE